MADVSIETRILLQGEENILASVAADVFDDPIDEEVTRQFLADPRHHLAVAIDDGVVVAMASGVHYIHPDKLRPELWINEVGVSSTHRGKGIGKAVVRALLQHARELGCAEAWVLADRDNHAATSLYASVGAQAYAPEIVMFEYNLDEHDES